MIAHALAKELNVPAYIYDGITVDELTDINRITGLPEMHRKGIGHNLNTRAAAMRYAREQGKAYKDITVIVAHLGGGITVNLHHNGRIEDCVNDEGPFSPERAGGLPMYDVIHRSFEEGQSDKSMMKLVKEEPGRPAGPPRHHRLPRGGAPHPERRHSRQADLRRHGPERGQVHRQDGARRLRQGGRHPADRRHHLLRFYRRGDPPPRVLHCSRHRLSRRGGEDEMQSLAFGCLRVLRGEETARTYTKVE